MRFHKIINCHIGAQEQDNLQISMYKDGHMTNNTQKSLSAEIQLLRIYLESMENAIKVDDGKYQEEKAKLEKEAEDLRRQIDEERQKIENLSDEEQMQRDLKAIEEWENSWMDGDPYSYHFPSSNSSYYDTPEYELELTEIYIHENEYMNVTFDFREVLRSSFFTHIYTFIEYRMNAICEDIKSLKNCPFSVNDLNFRGIFRAKDYLQKVANLNLTTVSGWKE
jgi:hypothetical protein